MRARRGEGPNYLDVTYRRTTELVGEELADRLFPTARPVGDDFDDDLFGEAGLDMDRRWLPTACRYDGSPRPYCKKAALFLGSAVAVICGLILLVSSVAPVEPDDPRSWAVVLAAAVIGAIVSVGAFTVIGVTEVVNGARRMKVADRPVSMADAGELVDLLRSMERHGIPTNQAVKDRMQSIESIADLRNADLQRIAVLLNADLIGYRNQIYSKAAREAAKALGAAGKGVHDGERPAAAEVHQ